MKTTLVKRTPANVAQTCSLLYRGFSIRFRQHRASALAFGDDKGNTMKTLGIQLSFLLLLGACTIARCEPATERVDKLKVEIARLEAGCVPTNGTSRADVETKFGPGSPAMNSKVPLPGGIPADSPYRSYDFCTNGTLFVCFDKSWHVVYAHYLDPYQTKGRVGSIGSIIKPEEEARELEQRLQQMKEIVAEYAKRFGAKSAVTAEPDGAANRSQRPPLSLHDALSRAENYITEKNIDVSKHFVSSVRYTESGSWTNSSIGKGPYWQVTYELVQPADGGQHFILIYMDGKAGDIGGL